MPYSVSELRILLTVVDAASGQLAKISGDLAALDALAGKSSVSQAKLFAAQERAALAAANASNVNLSSARAVSDAYANQALRAETAGRAITDAQNVVNNTRKAEQIAVNNLGFAEAAKNATTESGLNNILKAELALDKAQQAALKSPQMLQAARNAANREAIAGAEAVAAAESQAALSVQRAQQQVITAQRAVTAAEQEYQGALAGQSAVWQRIGTAANGVVSAVGRVATVGAIGFGALTGVVTAVGLGFDSMRQKADITFGALMGNKALGSNFVDQLFAFTRKTALGFQEVINAATEFRARGFQIGEIIPTLKAVGDAAAAMPRPIAESMQIISFNLGQIHSSATLSQRDMRDLSNAGVKSWEYLAAAEKTSVAQLRTDLEKNKTTITGAFAFDAIVKGMEKDFGGMLEIQRNTFAGLIAVGRRTFTELAGTFAQPLFDKLNKDLISVVDRMQNGDLQSIAARWGQEFASMISVFESGFVHGVIPGLQWLINNRTALIAAIAGLGLAFAWVHPVAALFAAGGLLIAGIGLMKTRSEELSPTMLAIKIQIDKVAVAFENAKNHFSLWANDLSKFANFVMNIRINYEGTTIGTLLAQLGELVSKVWNVRVSIGLGGISLGDIGNYIKDAVLNKATFGLYGAAQALTSSPGGTIPWDKMTDAQRQLSNDKGIQENLANRAGLGDISQEVDILAQSARSLGLDAAAAVPPIKDLGAAEDNAKKKADILADGIITYAEALERGFTPQQAGLLEAYYDQTYKLDEVAFNTSKTIAKLTNELILNEKAGQKLILALGQETLGKLQAAAAALFSKPTVEQASLQAQIAAIQLRLASVNAMAEPTRQADERTIERIKAEIKGLEDQKDKVDTEAKKQIEEQIDIRQKAIDRLKKTDDSFTSQLESLLKQTQMQLEFETAKTTLSQAELTLADNTLLTATEQYNAALQMKDLIGQQSYWVRANISSYQQLVPEINSAKDAFHDFVDVVHAVQANLATSTTNADRIKGEGRNLETQARGG